MKKPEKFWKWFTENSERIFNFEENQEEIFEEISAELEKFHSGLAFEISSISEGKREFIVSADGILEAFPSVEHLYSKAPDLPFWNFIKFRPRIAPNFSVKMHNLELSTEDLTFKLEQDEDKIGIMLFIKGYEDNPEETGIYRQIVYLILDGILGEYDMETKVGYIEMFPEKSNWSVAKKTVRLLPEIFDKKYKSLFN